MSRHFEMRKQLMGLYYSAITSQEMLGINRPLCEDLVHTLNALEHACSLLRKEGKRVTADSLIDESRRWSPLLSSPDLVVPQSFGNEKKSMQESIQEIVDKNKNKPWETLKTFSKDARRLLGGS